MQITHLRAVTPLLLGAAALVAGCTDFAPVEVELRNQDQAETEGPAEQGDLLESDDIPGHYIVMMKRGADPHAAAAAVHATPNEVFTHVMSGFAGPLNQGQLTALSHRNDVVRIEPDQVVSATATACPGQCPESNVMQSKSGSPDYAPSYSVDRVDQRNLPLSSTYTYTCGGEDVNVYVLDTWMHAEHPDFGQGVDSRASRGYDGYPNEPPNGEGCSGHATHVAGIIGGEKYGVAKHANLISVKVLDCTGHGSWSKLLAGMDWIQTHKGNTPAVANMSLSGRKSFIVEWAVNDLAASGVFVAVAAGNNNANACNYSPAGATSVAVAAAHDSGDRRASFSNYGSCVDLYAGGVYVRSAWPGGGWAIASGTSMASPHVAGVAALYKQAFGDAPWLQIKSDLESWATQNKISGNPASTPNLMLYWPCSGSPT